VILAVSLANARFLPMAVSFITLMRDGIKRFGWMFALVQLLSINSWAAGLRSFPEIEVQLRARYYVLFALICMSAGLLGTSIGYYGIGIMNRAASLGLIFLNPLFFAVLLAGSHARPAIIAMLIGIPLGPILHMLSPDWGLLVTGLMGGTLAFLIHRKIQK
jgi:predicted branched-subunit amino acid permease